MGGEMIYQYNSGKFFKGFNAKLSKQLVQSLQDDPMIREIHVNHIAYTTQQKCHVRQDEAPSWGLTRVSHQGAVDGGMNNHYSHHENGAGVRVYVLDTGVFVDHADIRGRATWGANFITGSIDGDRNGHGSHCAGTIGGSEFGVAKQTHIVAVKVLSDQGSGSYGGIIEGINWVVKDLQAQPAGTRGIISMSLGGGSDGGMQPSIQAAKEAGIPVVAAAGNSNADACFFYPAGFPECITVGATDAEDVRSYFSNWGQCVDIFAPGTGITSIWWDGSTNVLSGTSMACPHVAGEAAVLLSQNPTLDPDSLLKLLQASAQTELITNPGNASPNLLLYNGCPN
jgi:subtilisin family serine protease